MLRAEITIFYSLTISLLSKSKKTKTGEVPGGPVVRTRHIHCCGPGLNPWWGNLDPASCAARPKELEFK